MRVLITGITGFVGGHLARYLTARDGYEILGLATQSESCPVEGVHVYDTDISDRQALGKAVADCNPDAIVHLAGLSHVGESWKRPGDYLRVNFGGTRNLMHVADGRRVLFASSAEVYGNVPKAEQPIKEDRAPDNVSFSMPRTKKKDPANFVIARTEWGASSLVVVKGHFHFLVGVTNLIWDAR